MKSLSRSGDSHTRTPILNHACTVRTCLYRLPPLPVGHILSMKSTSFQLMFFTGVWDILGMLVSGFTHAAAINGDVYSSRPTFTFTDNGFGEMCWMCESSGALLVALNRYFEMTRQQRLYSVEARHGLSLTWSIRVHRHVAVRTAHHSPASTSPSSSTLILTTPTTFSRVPARRTTTFSTTIPIVSSTQFLYCFLLPHTRQATHGPVAYANMCSFVKVTQ